MNLVNIKPPQPTQPTMEATRDQETVRCPCRTEFDYTPRGCNCSPAVYDSDSDDEYCSRQTIKIPCECCNPSSTKTKPRFNAGDLLKKTNWRDALFEDQDAGNEIPSVVLSDFLTDEDQRQETIREQTTASGYSPASPIALTVWDDDENDDQIDDDSGVDAGSQSSDSDSNEDGREKDSDSDNSDSEDDIEILAVKRKYQDDDEFARYFEHVKRLKLMNELM